jgi:branched-chain amino acid transport system substrate-binding protein
MTKLVEEDKAVAVMGGSLTNYALAISAIAKRTKTPFIASNAVAREVTGKECHPYVFRLPTTTPTVVKAMTPTLSTLGKRWYFLVSAFGFGLDTYAAFKSVMKDLGGTEVGYDQTPLGTNDFSAFLLKIRQAKPDVVICGVPGQDFSNLLKQYKEFGLRGRVPLVQPSVGDNDLWAIGPETAAGICGAPWHYSDAANPADEKAMVAAYIAKNGKPPAPGVWLGWLSMRFVLAAITKANTTDSGAIVRALEDVRLGDENSPAYFRKWDHQMMHRTLVTKVKDKITDKWDFVDIIDQAPKTPVGLDALFGTPAEIGCTMGEI